MSNIPSRWKVAFALRFSRINHQQKGGGKKISGWPLLGKETTDIGPLRSNFVRNFKMRGDDKMRKAGLIILMVAVATAGFFFMAVQRSLADTLLFDRGLPATNVNTGISNQSNVAWADTESSANPSEYWLPGDDFTLSTNASVNDIRVWVVATGTSAPGYLPSGISLLGGKAGGTISTISQSFTATSVQYSNGQSYQGSSGNFWDLYQVDFSTTGLNLTAGETYDFFVDQPYVIYSTTSASPYADALLAASNAGLSGSTQQGANGQFLWLDVNGSSQTVETWYSGDGGGTTGWGPGWDKNTDANVQVFGVATPEPPCLLLIVVPFMGLAALKLRFRRT
ncbi:MAG: hypothetical protein ACP5SH_24625 [Syntrophobacteraceae bacterium]